MAEILKTVVQPGMYVQHMVQVHLEQADYESKLEVADMRY